MSLIENLVQTKTMRVNAWKMSPEADETDVRHTLLDIRQSLITTLVVVCDCPLTAKILHQVSLYRIIAMIVCLDRCVME